MNNPTTNTVQRHRKKKAPISSEAQWEAVSSAVRFEIISFLTATGPCSIAELAKQMDTRADGLYHHIKKLVSAEVVEEVGFRRVGKQTEAIYDVVAEKFAFDVKNVETARFLKLMKSIYRRSERIFEQSLDAGLVDFEDKTRNSYLRSDTSWLTRKQQLKVNSLLNEVFEIFAEGRMERDGELFSLTLNLTPIQRSSRD